ncbi:MAG: restriction endonuclease subunit S [Rhodocyclales bacterium]|nr:restriction endonuclease subunit S [Rhodocyclales bacterium]
MSCIPSDWVATKLRELVSLKTGPFGSSLHQSDYVADGIPIINPMHIANGSISPTAKHRVSAETAARLSEFRVESGDIVIGRRGEMGRCAVVRSHQSGWLCGTGSLVIRSAKGLVPDFLQHYLSSDASVNYLLEASVGSTMANLNQEVLLGMDILLPPTAEQTRIVEKLEELLSDLDAGVAELKAAQKKLAQYRQSLLKSAVEGSLTAQWRAEAKVGAGETANETGAQLLERILRERRARWEAKQLAKFKEQGKTPPKDWQDKYPEPVRPDTSDLPALPERWAWASVDSLLSEIETGKSFKCVERPPRPSEIGVVKVSAVSWGEYDEGESKTCTDPERMNEGLFIREGDFLFSRANTIELVGACVIAESVRLRMMLSDKILRFVVVWDDVKNWLLGCLRSEVGRSQIELLASGNQESMRNIGQERIRQIAIPLPPSVEMKQILEQLDQQLSAAKQLDASVAAGLKQSAAQRKNILKAAFSGQIVPQDPNDEPADVLLERIKAERNARETGRMSRRKAGLRGTAETAAPGSGNRRTHRRIKP